MDNVAHNIIFSLIGFIVALNLTIFFYQRKMSALYRQVGGLLMEVGAMEFIIRQTEFRLHETNKIAKRMENIIQGFVTSSSCDHGECDMMLGILKEFKYVQQINDAALARLDRQNGPMAHRKERDGQ